MLEKLLYFQGIYFPLDRDVLSDGILMILSPLLTIKENWDLNFKIEGAAEKAKSATGRIYAARSKQLFLEAKVGSLRKDLHHTRCNASSCLGQREATQPEWFHSHPKYEKKNAKRKSTCTERDTSTEILVVKSCVRRQIKSYNKWGIENDLFLGRGSLNSENVLT